MLPMFVYTVAMNPYEKAEAAYKRLIADHGSAQIAAVCIHPYTRKPITRQAVEKWEVVPFVHLKNVAKLAGCKMKDLRPDLPTLQM